MASRRDYVKYFVASMASIADWKIPNEETLSKLRVSFEDKYYHAQLIIIDRVEDRGQRLHSGLDIIAILDHHSMNEVGTLSGALVDTVLDVISFITVAHCERLTTSSLITFGDDGATTGRLYCSPPPSDFFTTAIPRSIDKDVLKAVFAAKDRSPDKVRERVSRSLAWFRKSIVDKDAVTRFISLWIALETISPVLKDELQQRKPEKWDGVRGVFADKIPAVRFDDIRLARRTLFHSLGQITPQFKDELGGFAEPLRRALIFGIGAILKLDKTAVERIAGLTTLNMFSISSIGLSGKFHNLPNDIDRLMKRYPEIKANKFNYRYFLYEQGRPGVDFSFDLKTSLPEGVIFTAEGGSLSGRKDAGVEPARFRISE